MKKRIALSLFLVLAAATVAFGHAGEVHSYMGTVEALQADGSFTLNRTNGDAIHVYVAKTTAYLHADGQAASASELKPGSRVVVKMSTDGKTASSVKMAAARK